MHQPQYRRRASRPSSFQREEELSVETGFFREYAPYVLGGILLVAAFAFAGHQIGRNAVASTAPVGLEAPLAAESPLSDGKGSLLDNGVSLRLASLTQPGQSVAVDGKGDMTIVDLGEAPAPAVPAGPRPVLKPLKKLLAAKDRLRIEPAAVNLKEDDTSTDDQNAKVKRLAVAPKPDNLEDTFKLDKAEKQKVIAQRRVRLAEENCLARAVYFEARSESEIGQMAVAKVILNRTKSPNYPKTICGVVYQGSNRRNSCQFSFACDGLPDDVKQPAAWAQAKSIAQRAIAGDVQLGKGMNTATSYHADYVTPRWARSLRKVMKIGRHIFYAGG